MNNHQSTLLRISEILNKSQSGAIITPTNPTVDTLAAATALYLGLAKLNKNVSLSASTKPQSDLTGVEKFQTTIGAGGDSLMVSFPYVDGAIDKVDYNIQGESFNLIISPRQGYPKLNPNQVNFSYTGGSIDFIFVIDSATLNNLGSIYTDNQNMFIGHDIINIDRHLTNAYFGTVNFIDKTISSVSELILRVLQNQKIEIDREIATNLYAGIAASTNNFTSYSTNANTFENIATLLRAGAIKKPFKKLSPTPQITNQPPTIRSFRGQPETQPITRIEEVEKEKNPTDKQFEGKDPQEWLKPKIFKNGGII